MYVFGVVDDMFLSLTYIISGKAFRHQIFPLTKAFYKIIPFSMRSKIKLEILEEKKLMPV